MAKVIFLGGRGPPLKRDSPYESVGSHADLVVSPFSSCCLASRPSPSDLFGAAYETGLRTGRHIWAAALTSSTIWRAQAELGEGYQDFRCDLVAFVFVVVFASMYLYSVCLYLYLCQCICICDCLSAIWYSPQCRVKDAHRAEDLELHTTTTKKLLSSQQPSILFQMSVQYHSPLQMRFPPPPVLFKNDRLLPSWPGSTGGRDLGSN